MFTEFSTIAGGSQMIKTERIFRFRSSFGEYEPENTTVVYYADKRFFAADSLKEAIKKVASDFPVAELTTPNGMTVAVNAEKVIEISEPIKALHHNKARSVITIYDQCAPTQQQLRETVKQAKKAIEKALKSFSQ